MDELLKAIEELKRAYNASGVGSVLVDLDEYNERVEIYDNERNEIKQITQKEIEETEKATAIWKSRYGIPKPITNGEWLRGLSDEELVCWLNMYRICTIEQLRPHNAQTIGETMCNWLRAEHKGVE